MFNSHQTRSSTSIMKFIMTNYSLIDKLLHKPTEKASLSYVVKAYYKDTDLITHSKAVNNPRHHRLIRNLRVNDQPLHTVAVQTCTGAVCPA